MFSGIITSTNVQVAATKDSFTPSARDITLNNQLYCIIVCFYINYFIIFCAFIPNNQKEKTNNKKIMQ